MMSVLVEHGGKRRVYVKGAPEVVLAHCAHFLEGQKHEEMTVSKAEELLAENQNMTTDSLRTLALAYKDFGSEDSYKEEGFTYLGLVGMEDPPREEASEAVKICEQAGIKVKMITGDNKHTAVAIASQIGVDGRVMEGGEIDKLTDEELKNEVLETSIFVRVKPEHKLRIVRALKAHGEIVAMTGDGVNDAPALKEAHIGIAMGKRGTDVSRSVSDIILSDDNFATIVKAIGEGRTIFSNVRKFVSYQLSCNFAELMILLIGVILAPYLGWEVPVLLAIQILFMNLVTDNLPALTLGFNPSSEDVFHGRPKKKMEIIDRNIVILILMTGFAMCSATLLTHFISFNIQGYGAEYARTEALVALILIEISTAFTFRSFRKKVLTRSPFVNKYLFIASIISIITTVIIVYTPASGIFETVPVSPSAWVIAAIAALALVAVYDIGKDINKKIRFIPAH
jgi:Ca2+-transporting ATPase